MQIAEIENRHVSHRPESNESCYDIYMGLGHLFSLIDDPDVFRVSTAGHALGYYLLRNLRENELTGRILDLGTGSGIQALLLRDMGATRVTATDISSRAVAAAKENEVRHFGDLEIEYLTGNLFDALQDPESKMFDLIIFNPPGWRSPSDELKAKLSRSSGGIDLNAMFYGDGVVVDFLTQLPAKLCHGGRAIIGLNSLIGIADVLRRGNEVVRDIHRKKLKYRLLERIEIPLLLYTQSWHDARADLIGEFEHWRRNHRAAFSNANGRFTWYYEITEISVVDLI